MSHHVSDLAMYRIGAEIPSYGEQSVYLFPVVFIDLGDGRLSWRGVGQVLPQGRLAGVGVVGFVGDEDGSSGMADEWSLEILPAFVQVDDDLFESWADLQWDDHEVNWATNGHGRLVAAQYQRAK